VLVALAVAIRRASPGPALFRQVREGAGGRRILVLKLRTMEVDAEAALAGHLARTPAADDEWRRYRRLADDPRLIPRWGRPLRRPSLDELPQLWNVVRGDMRLVGPRPLELEVLDRFPVEDRRLRWCARPGLTGLWQVSGRSDLDLDGLRELDRRYLHSWSFGMDLRILRATPRALLSREGAF